MQDAIINATGHIQGGAFKDCLLILCLLCLWNHKMCIFLGKTRLHVHRPFLWTSRNIKALSNFTWYAHTDFRDFCFWTSASFWSPWLPFQQKPLLHSCGSCHHSVALEICCSPSTNPQVWLSLDIQIVWMLAGLGPGHLCYLMNSHGTLHTKVYEPVLYVVIFLGGKSVGCFVSLLL